MTAHVLTIFDRRAPEITRAFEPAVVAGLREAVGDGRAQLWPADDAVIVTEVNDYPLTSARVLVAWLIGKPERTEALLPGIFAWADVAGCTDRDVRRPPRRSPEA